VVVLLLELLEPPPHPVQLSIRINAMAVSDSSQLFRFLEPAAAGNSNMAGIINANMGAIRSPGRTSLASEVVVWMVMVTTVAVVPIVPLSAEKVQLASDGMPAHFKVTPLAGTLMLALRFSDTWPDCPAVMVTLELCAARVNTGCVTVMLAMPVDGASLAASPLKQAAMLVLLAPIAEPATFAKVVVEQPVLPQGLVVEGTRLAVPSAVPVQAEPG